MKSRHAIVPTLIIMGGFGVAFVAYHELSGNRGAPKCDVRQIEIGSPAELVRELCGAPYKIAVSWSSWQRVEEEQWIYDGRTYVYVVGGKVKSTQQVGYR